MAVLTRPGRLPRGVRLLIVARAVNRLGAFSLGFLAALIANELDTSKAAAGMIVAAFGLATIPSRLFGGHLADRLGRRRTIVLGLTGCALAQLGIAASTSVAMVAFFAILLGLVFELYEPPSQAMIADAVDPSDRPRAYSLFNAALAAGGMGAGLIAAGVGRWDLRWLFVVDALTCLACAIVVQAVLPADRPSPRRPDASRNGDAWRDPALLTMLVNGTLFALVYMQIIVALSLSLEHQGMDYSDAGLLFTISAATTIAGQPLLRLAKIAALPATTALAYGSILLSAGLAGYAAARTLPLLALATVVWSIGDILIFGRLYAMVADLSPEDARGRYLSIFGLSWGVATIAAPLTATQLLEHTGVTGLWTTASLLCLALAAAQPTLVKSRASISAH